MSWYDRRDEPRERCVHPVGVVCERGRVGVTVVQVEVVLESADICIPTQLAGGGRPATEGFKGRIRGGRRGEDRGVRGNTLDVRPLQDGVAKVAAEACQIEDLAEGDDGGGVG